MFSSRSLSNQRYLVLPAILIMVAAALSAMPEDLSLDGIWDIVFDPENEGREAGWFDENVFMSLDTRKEIPVPAAWELTEEDYEGVAFYRKAFTVPPDWEDQVVRLQFGAVNYICEVWLNGEAVGTHEGGFTPFEFRVDRILKPGETNVILLRVVGPIFFGDKKVDGIGALETPQWRGGITGGVWQSVRLLVTGPAYLDDVYLKTNVSGGTVDFQVEINHLGAMGSPAVVELEIVEKDKPSNSVTSFVKRMCSRSISRGACY